MDAEGRIIPIVEDDQGEGFKDELPLESEEAFDKAIEDLVLKRKSSGKDEKKTETSSLPQPKRMKMAKGMPIDFMGHGYKVISVKRNSKGETVKLRYKGELTRRG